MPKLKLTYFNMPGRAEPVRLALKINGIDFEDNRISGPEFGALRQSDALPLGSVPTLEVDGLVMTQTGAMLRYVAKLGDAGLYPEDPFEAFIVDSVIDCFNDTLATAMAPSFREQDLEKRIAMRRELATGTMAKVFKHTESLIARSGGPFLLGDRLSIADLVVACNIMGLRSGNLDGLSADDAADYPLINALTDAALK